MSGRSVTPELKKYFVFWSKGSAKPKANRYMDKKLSLSLNGDRKVIGVLRGGAVCTECTVKQYAKATQDMIHF